MIRHTLHQLRHWLSPTLCSCFRRPSVSELNSNDDHVSHETPEGYFSVPPAWLKYPTSPPPLPRELFANRDAYGAAMDQRDRKSHPIHPQNDNRPLFALCRLYEAIVLDRNIDLRNEIEWFWRKRDWPVKEIPDPKDSDPERYAVLACIPPLINQAYNRLIGLGLPRDAPALMTTQQLEEMKQRPKMFEESPEWVAHVPPLEATLKVPHRAHGYTGPWETYR